MASASLTHVCRWSENGWKRITAEQAAKLHPGGTVSAHSGLFMCELADSMSFLPMEVSINEGSGQGSVCSPVISCVYMHYVLVWWFKEVITPKLKGYAGIVVYADDFVVTFQYKTDAEWFYEHLKHRMGYFGLSLEEEKNNKQYFTRCKVVFYRI